VDQEAHAGDDQDHHHRQGVEDEPHRNREVARVDPGEGLLQVVTLVGRELEERLEAAERDHERDPDRAGSDRAHDLARQPPGAEAVHDGADERKRRNPA
jgi:hypothetical protein